MREINGKTYIEKEPHDMQELLEIVEVLRSPDGCSWDREQTHESLKKCFMDETEEVMQAIDHRMMKTCAKNWEMCYCRFS